MAAAEGGGGGNVPHLDAGDSKPGGFEQQAGAGGNDALSNTGDNAYRRLVSTF